MIFETEVPLLRSTPYIHYTEGISFTAGRRIRITPQVHFYPYEQHDLPEGLEWSNETPALAYLSASHPSLVNQVGEDNFRQALHISQESGAMTFILTPRTPFTPENEVETKAFFMGQFNTDIILHNWRSFLANAIGMHPGATAFNRDDIDFREVIMRRFYNFYGAAVGTRVLAFGHPNTSGTYPETGGICWGSNQPPAGDTPRERAENSFGILAKNTCMASPLSISEGLPCWRRPVRIQLHGIDTEGNPHALEIDMKMVAANYLQAFDSELRDHSARAQNVNDGPIWNTYVYGDASSDVNAILTDRGGPSTGDNYKTSIRNLIKELKDTPEGEPIIREINWELSRNVWPQGLYNILTIEEIASIEHLLN